MKISFILVYIISVGSSSKSCEECSSSWMLSSSPLGRVHNYENDFVLLGDSSTDANVNAYLPLPLCFLVEAKSGDMRVDILVSIPATVGSV